VSVGDCQRVTLNLWGQRCWDFRDWRTSRDLEQRKVWHLWYSRYEQQEPELAREMMAYIHQAEYKVNGEVWQGIVKRPRGVQ